MKAIKMLVAVFTTAVLLSTASFAQTSSTPSTGGGGGSSSSGDGPQIEIIKNLPSFVKDGQEVTVSWRTTNAPAGATVSVKMVAPYGQEWWGYTVIQEWQQSAASFGAFRFTARTLSEKSELYRLVVSLYVPSDQGKKKVSEATSKNLTKIHLAGKPRSLDICYPIPGQSLATGSTTLIQWRGVNLPANANLHLYGEKLNTPEGQSFAFGANVQNTGGYMLDMSDFPSGDYAFSLTYRNEYGSGELRSESYFTLRRPQPVVITEK